MVYIYIFQKPSRRVGITLVTPLTPPLYLRQRTFQAESPTLNHQTVGWTDDICFLLDLSWYCQRIHENTCLFRLCTDTSLEWDPPSIKQTGGVDWSWLDMTENDTLLETDISHRVKGKASSKIIGRRYVSSLQGTTLNFAVPKLIILNHCHVNVRLFSQTQQVTQSSKKNPLFFSDGGKKYHTPPWNVQFKL